MEDQLRASLTPEEQRQLRPEDYENFYQLLGSYRGLSESVVEYADLASESDWRHWEENRF